MAKNIGKITQVIGSTLDAQFAEDQLPAIYNALKVEVTQEVMGEKITETLWCEVAQHLGGGRVRAVVSGFDGRPAARRGHRGYGGSRVSVPVGDAVLGRVFNLVGEPIDGRGPVAADQTRSIHREPPKLDKLSSKTEIFETGIKVVDLLCPLGPWW